MTNNEMREELNKAILIIENVRNNMPIDPPVPSNVIKTEEEFDAALASDVDVIRLATQFVYNKPLIIKRKVAIGMANPPHDQRVSPTDALPWFKRGITISANEVALIGLKVTDDNLDDIIVCSTGIINTYLSQLLILGDERQGNKRGIYCNTNGRVEKCYIDLIWRVGQDTQAIFVSAMLQEGLEIDDCFLSAAGQSFMAGGEDFAGGEKKPRGIKIRNSDLVKNGVYYTNGSQRKCSLELKNVRGFEMTHCLLAGAGIAQGQGGFLMVFTPRNQDGKDPTSSIEDVVIEDCEGREAGGIASFLGDDNINPSGKLRSLRIERLIAHNIDPKGITGGVGRLFYISRVPEKITLSFVEVMGQNLKSAIYFDGIKPPIGLVVNDYHFPGGMPYTFHNPLGDSLASAQKYAPDAIFTNVSART